jgi:hypothetical protein
MRLEPGALMDLILRPETWPRWQSEIETATGPDRVAPGDRVEGRARMLGFIVSGRSGVLRVTPYGLEQDAVVGVRMRIHYTVRPAPGGAVVEHRVAASLPRGPMGSLLSLFLRPRLRTMQRRTLAGLAREGERWTSEG